MSAPELAAAAADQAGADGDLEGEVAIMSAINITPLTDVILVLLIIFMVSSSAMVDAAREGRLDVSLPRAGSAASRSLGAPPLIVGVAADGRPFVHGSYVTPEALATLLAEAHAQAPDTTVIVDADGNLAHRQVVEIIDRVRAAGFQAVGIGAEAP